MNSTLPVFSQQARFDGGIALVTVEPDYSDSYFSVMFDGHCDDPRTVISTHISKHEAIMAAQALISERGEGL